MDTWWILLLVFVVASPSVLWLLARKWWRPTLTKEQRIERLLDNIEQLPESERAKIDAVIDEIIASRNRSKGQRSKA